MVVTDPKNNAVREKATSQDVRAGSDARGARAADHVAEELEALCATLGAGDRLPTHPELMRQLGASERAVREALDALQRRGRIVRRQGSGTYVSDAADLSEAKAHPALLPAQAGKRTVVAIAAADHGFFDRSVETFCQYAEAAELAPVCRPISDLSQDNVSQLARSLTDSSAAGFIVFSFALEPLARQLQESGARVVLFGTPPVGATLSVPCVCGDQEYGGYLVARHLLELGHRHLARVHNPIQNLGPVYVQTGWASAVRWRGYQRAVQEAQRRGLLVREGELNAAESWSSDPSRAATFLRTPGAPTALVCWNDLEAAKLLSVLNRAGVKVPEEVSLVGYDDLPEATLVYPALTTVDPSGEEMIRIAIDLINRSELPDSGRTVLVPKLVARDSSAPPPPTNPDRDDPEYGAK